MNEQLKDALTKDFVKFTFIKKDGTERTFDKATTNLALISESYWPTGKNKKAQRTIRVFVDELQEWRSVSLDANNHNIKWEYVK